MLLIVETAGCACNATHYVSVTLYSNFIFVSIITDLRPVVSPQDGAHLDIGDNRDKNRLCCETKCRFLIFYPKILTVCGSPESHYHHIFL